MRKLNSVIGLVCCGLLVLGGVAIGDYSNWNNNENDLWGSNSIQSRMDELDNRLGGTGTVAMKRAILGSSDTVQMVEWTGTCTNGETVTISEAFTSATGISVHLTPVGYGSVLVYSSANSVTTNSFQADGCPGITNYYRFVGPGVK